MTKTDGGLSDIFISHLPKFHFQKIENWSTGQGVPDLNFCFDSTEGWIENKKTEANKLSHPITPEQIAWTERRVRAGGRLFIAVRRARPARPRLGPAIDELHLFPGAAVRALALHGIFGPQPLKLWPGGPARWDWAEIQAILTQKRT